MDAKIFLNIEILGSGYFAFAGDFCLKPVRYFFHGFTARLIGRQDSAIHHVHSYTREPEVSKTDPALSSSQKSLLKTVAMIAGLIPGFILGVIGKLFAYMFAEMRERHRIVKKHFESEGEKPVQTSIPQQTSSSTPQKVNPARNLRRERPLSGINVEILDSNARIKMNIDRRAEECFETLDGNNHALNWNEFVWLKKNQYEVIEFHIDKEINITSIIGMQYKPKKIILCGKAQFGFRETGKEIKEFCAEDGRYFEVVQRDVKSLKKALKDKIPSKLQNYTAFYSVKE